MSADHPKRTSNGRGHPWMDTKLRGSIIRSRRPRRKKWFEQLSSFRRDSLLHHDSHLKRGHHRGRRQPPPNERCQHWGHGDGALTALTDRQLGSESYVPIQARCAPGARPGSGTRTLPILSTKAQIECDYSNNSESCDDSNPNTYSPLLGKRIALRCTHPWPQRCTTNVCPNFLPNPIAIRLRRAQA